VVDDGALVRQCLAGDAESLRAFVERFQGPVLGLCYRMLGHRQDAEDIVQDVFLRAFRSLSRWDPTRELKPWLFTIAANRCRTHLSNRSRQMPLYESAPEASTAAPDHAAADLAEELQRALANLREEYRLCFVLFHEQELSCAEIGTVLGCPQGTVKTWLHRARRELAEQLAGRGFLVESARADTV
jgi:RNA polymerase sigma-70 factor (ECF subfamily)